MIEISIICIIVFWIVASIIEIVRIKILEEKILTVNKINKICDKTNKIMDIE